jgi:hypothetical protein
MCPIAAASSSASGSSSSYRIFGMSKLPGLSSRDDKFCSARATCVGILPTHAPIDWSEWPSNAAQYPAAGARIVAPDLHREIRKALVCEVNRIKFRLLLRKRRLLIEYFSLKARRAVLLTARYFCRNLAEFGGRKHG